MRDNDISKATKSDNQGSLVSQIQASPLSESASTNKGAGFFPTYEFAIPEPKDFKGLGIKEPAMMELYDNWADDCFTG